MFLNHQGAAVELLKNMYVVSFALHWMLAQPLITKYIWGVAGYLYFVVVVT